MCLLHLFVSHHIWVIVAMCLTHRDETAAANTGGSGFWNTRPLLVGRGCLTAAARSESHAILSLGVGSGWYSVADVSMSLSQYCICRLLATVRLCQYRLYTGRHRDMSCLCRPVSPWSPWCRLCRLSLSRPGVASAVSVPSPCRLCRLSAVSVPPVPSLCRPRVASAVSLPSLRRLAPLLPASL